MFKIIVLFVQSCLILRDSIDYSSPGSSVHGIFQARILEWVAMPFFPGKNTPGDLHDPGIEPGSPKNTGVGCHFCLRGIFPTQGWSPQLLHLLHCRQILYLFQEFAIREILKDSNSNSIWSIMLISKKEFVIFSVIYFAFQKIILYAAWRADTVTRRQSDKGWRPSNMGQGNYREQIPFFTWEHCFLNVLIADLQHSLLSWAFTSFFCLFLSSSLTLHLNTIIK